MSLHKCRGHFAMLVGSGISRNSGIPTGWEIVLDMVVHYAEMQGEDAGDDPAAWYRARTGEDPDYSKLLHQLGRSSTERSLLLRSYFEPTPDERARGIKTPTAAHRAMARLAARGVVQVFLTTNFDRLLEKALDDEGVVATVIGTPDALDGAVPLSHSEVVVVKLHGDYRDTRIKNTPEELEEYDPRINRLLDRVIDEYGLVVCGWSAQWDKALVSAVERCESHRYTTYWADVCPLKGRAASLLERRKGVFVDIDGADGFFDELERRVSVLEARPPRSSGAHSTAEAEVAAAVASQPVAAPEPAQLAAAKPRRAVVVVGLAVVIVAAAVAGVLLRPSSGDTQSKCFVPKGDKRLEGGIARYKWYDKEAMRSARKDFKALLKAFPQYAEAEAWLGHTYWIEWDRQWSQKSSTLLDASGHVSDAAEKCGQNPLIRARVAWVQLHLKNFGHAKREFKEARRLAQEQRLNEKDQKLEKKEMDKRKKERGQIEAYYAQYLNYTGDHKAAAQVLDTLRGNNEPAYYNLYRGHAHFLDRKPELALRALKKAVQRKHTLLPVHRLLAVVYAEANEPKLAKAQVDEVLEQSPNVCLKELEARLPYKDPTVRERVLAGLKKAGFKDCPRSPR